MDEQVESDQWGKEPSRLRKWLRQTAWGRKANSRKEMAHGGDLGNAMKLKCSWGPCQAIPRKFSFI